MRRALLLGLVLVTACTDTTEPPPQERIECMVRFAAPGGFEPLPAFEEEYADHIGLRLGFRDETRRELHVFAGIPGEIGEGLPEIGPVELAEDRTGCMLGRKQVWVVLWREGDLCDPRAVLGNGFSRRAFLATLADTGLAPPET